MSATPRRLFLLPAVIVLGVVVRLLAAWNALPLSGPGRFADVLTAWSMLSGADVSVGPGSVGWFTPSPYHALCADVWAALRLIEPERVLRMQGLMWGVLALCVPLVSYRLVREVGFPRADAALVAAAFTVLAPMLLSAVPPELTADGLCGALCAVGFYCLVRAIKGGSFMHVVGAGVALGIALLTRLSAIPICGASIVALIAAAPRQRPRRVVALQVIGFGVSVASVLLAYGRWGAVLTGHEVTASFEPLAQFGIPVASGLALSLVAVAIFLAAGVAFVGCARRARLHGWEPVVTAAIIVALLALCAGAVDALGGFTVGGAASAYLIASLVPVSLCVAGAWSKVTAMGKRETALAAGLLSLAALAVVVRPATVAVFGYGPAPYHDNALAVLTYAAGFREEARRVFARLADGQLHLAHENLASIELEGGHLHPALRHLQAALHAVVRAEGLRPGEVAVVRADYYNSMAVIAEQMRWPRVARVALRRALRLDPTLTAALYNHGVLLLETGDPVAAREHFARHMFRLAQLPHAALLYAVAAQRAGDCVGAMEALAYADSAVREPPTAGPPRPPYQGGPQGVATRRFDRPLAPSLVRRGNRAESATVHGQPFDVDQDMLVERSVSHLSTVPSTDGALTDVAITRRRRIEDLPPFVDATYTAAVCEARDHVRDSGQRLRTALANGTLRPGALADESWRGAARGRLVPMVLPNIIVVMIDTLRADHVGAYGYTRPTTPNLDQLAANGVRFANAFSVSSWTGPAVASLFTGVLPSRHGFERFAAAMRDDIPTLAEELTRLGYRTAAFSANFVHVTERRGVNRGFGEFHTLEKLATGNNYLTKVKGTAFRGYNARELTDRVGQWLAGKPNEPFFLYVHYLDPHAGYEPPARYYAPFASADDAGVHGASLEELTPLERDGQWLDPAGLQHLINLYDGEIRFVDTEVGRLLDHLDGEGFCQNCVVVVVADHGEEFKDHQHLFHGYTLYDEMMRIPLIMYGRGTWNLDAAVVPDLVQLTDVFSTLIEVAGGVLQTGIDGQSLLPLLVNRGTYARDVVRGELQPDGLVDKMMHPKRHVMTVRDRQTKVLVAPDGSKELYRVDIDPTEQHDLSASQPEEIARLLRGPISAPPQPGPAPARSLTDAERERLRALGYLP